MCGGPKGHAHHAAKDTAACARAAAWRGARAESQAPGGDHAPGLQQRHTDGVLIPFTPSGGRPLREGGCCAALRALPRGVPRHRGGSNAAARACAPAHPGCRCLPRLTQPARSQRPPACVALGRRLAWAWRAPPKTVRGHANTHIRAMGREVQACACVFVHPLQCHGRWTCEPRGGMVCRCMCVQGARNAA